MDTVTQALLGAAVGQACFSHRLGRRAVVWGAVGGILPDLDVLTIAVEGPFAEFKYHRGITHSLWFGPVVGPALGWLVVALSTLARPQRSRALVGLDGAVRRWRSSPIR